MTALIMLFGDNVINEGFNDLKLMAFLFVFLSWLGLFAILLTGWQNEFGLNVGYLLFILAFTIHLILLYYVTYTNVNLWLFVVPMVYMGVYLYLYNLKN